MYFCVCVKLNMSSMEINNIYNIYYCIITDV